MTNAATLETLTAVAERSAPAVAAAQRCRAELEWRARSRPVPMSPRLRAALRGAIARAGLPMLELPSGAGHDAAVMAQAGIPSGVLFVPSLARGASHSPDEATSQADIGIAIAVARSMLAAHDTQQGLITRGWTKDAGHAPVTRRSESTSWALDTPTG